MSGALPSDIRPLIRMPAQIPAGQRSRVRKRGVHASPGLRRVERECRLPIFLQHRGGVIHHDRAISIPVGGHPNPKNDIVQAIRHRRHHRHGDSGDGNHPSQPHSQVGRRFRSHAPDYKPSVSKTASKIASLPASMTGGYLQLLLVLATDPSSRTLTTRPSDRQTTAFAGNRL
jgi:hypothetical protein